LGHRPFHHPIEPNQWHVGFVPLYRKLMQE
jgi:hypothetical protein